MIHIQEYKLDKKGKKMHRITDDKEFLSPFYQEMYPALASEIMSQYRKAENHWYYLSDAAYKQYQQHLHGFVTYAPKTGRR